MRGPPRPALLFNRGDPLSEYKSAAGSKGFVGQTLFAAALSGRFAGGLLHSRIPSLIGPVFGAIGSPFKPRAGRGYHRSAPRVAGFARMRHQVHGDIIGNIVGRNRRISNNGIANFKHLFQAERTVRRNRAAQRIANSYDFEGGWLAMVPFRFVVRAIRTYHAISGSNFVPKYRLGRPRIADTAQIRSEPV